MLGDCVDLFEKPLLAAVSYVGPGARLVTFPMWVDHDGHDVLISSPIGSRKGRSLRERPEVSISIIDPADAGHWISISGRVIEIRPDRGLEMADRMARKYFGGDYPRRNEREIFVVGIDRVQRAGAWSR